MPPPTSLRSATSPAVRERKGRSEPSAHTISTNQHPSNRTTPNNGQGSQPRSIASKLRAPDLSPPVPSLRLVSSSEDPGDTRAMRPPRPVSPRGRDAERSDAERAAPTEVLVNRSHQLPPLPSGLLPQRGEEERQMPSSGRTKTQHLSSNNHEGCCSPFGGG